jgi:hypothetical protein
VRISAEASAYLEDLVKVGLHGKTKAEVAKTLLSDAIQGLIKDEILVLHRQSGRPRSSSRTAQS